uniref:Uncharacterized protein n=1 Tax=Anguilla anguilla TaxID=7936 RepID=A0A0E9X723_ANGAN
MLLFEGFFKNRGGISPVCALLLQRTSEEQIKMKIAIHTVLGCVFHCKYCCIVFLVNCALRRFLLFVVFFWRERGLFCSRGI